jgi:predicted nucleic acid-binding protein
MARSPLLRVYHALDDILRLICKLPIKPFDEDAYHHYLGMPGHIDVNDRRIAAIALSNNFTVVSHNKEDFAAIKAVRPSLRIEDWVDTDFTARRS